MKFISLTIPLIIYCLIVCLAISPKAQAGQYTETIILKIQSYAYEQHDGMPSWGFTGTTPYINNKDYPVNYASIGNLAYGSGNYTFENLPPNAQNVSSVLLYTYASNLGAGGSEGNLNLHAWNGSTWDDDYYDYKISLVEGEGWAYRYVDWMQYGTITNATEVNNAQLWFSSSTLWTSSPSLFVDQIYLNVTCDIIPPFSVVDQHTWNGIFLGSLALMIWSPSWVAWKIKKKGIDSDTMERVGFGLILWIIGFGLFVSWLYH